MEEINGKIFDIVNIRLKLFSNGNFVEQRIVLGAVGVVTLTKVKHRREVLFAALPVLFAIHQFIEGFVWLGLDGILSPVVAHDMGAAFMLYAQGLLPFLLPLSVLLFEPNAKSRRRMWLFVVVGGGTTLYILWALTAYPLQLYIRETASCISTRRPTIPRLRCSM